ncbi:MAG TPA: RHS repeat-associated core domain-containing protein [Tepidisphaeraceae bacterium]|jgi:RHS repeat-associated protein
MIELDTDLNGTRDFRLWPTFDANYNTTGLLNDAGVTVERYAYTPYGERVIINGDRNYANTGEDPDNVNEWTVDTNGSDLGIVVGFQGLRFETEAGNWYQRARYTNSALGGFQQRDPLQSAYQDGSNLFQLELANPVVGLDPSGLWVTTAPRGSTRKHWKSDANFGSDTISDLAEKVKLSTDVGQVNKWLKGETLTFKDGSSAQVGSLTEADLAKPLCKDQKVSTPNVWIAANLLHGGARLIDPLINLGGGGVGTFIGTDLLTQGQNKVKVSSFSGLVNAIGANSGDIWGIVVFGHGNKDGRLEDADGQGGNQSEVINGLRGQGF